jgi:hypothetical protein
VLKRMEVLEERLVSSVLPDLVAQPAFIQVLYFECPPLTQVGPVCVRGTERGGGGGGGGEEMVGATMGEF